MYIGRDDTPCTGCLVNRMPGRRVIGVRLLTDRRHSGLMVDLVEHMPRSGDPARGKGGMTALQCDKGKGVAKYYRGDANEWHTTTSRDLMVSQRIVQERGCSIPAWDCGSSIS